MIATNFGLGDTALIVSEAKKAGVILRHLAYILATTYHETAGTMKPIREYGSDAYLRSKKYWPYVGMGYVQLTWLDNYKKASTVLGVDFVKTPALLLQSQYAAPILIRGMVEGWFTGKKLSSYADNDYLNMRSIINGDKNMYSPGDKNKDGTPKAGAATIGNKIAGYARIYEAMLIAAHYGELAANVAPAAPVAPAPATAPEVPKIDAPADTAIEIQAERTYSMWNWLKSLFS